MSVNIIYVCICLYCVMICTNKEFVEYIYLKGECSVFKKNILWMKTIRSLSEYNKIPLDYNCTNVAVYSKIYFKVEICSAH